MQKVAARTMSGRQCQHAGDIDVEGQPMSHADNGDDDDDDQARPKVCRLLSVPSPAVSTLTSARTLAVSQRSYHPELPAPTLSVDAHPPAFCTIPMSEIFSFMWTIAIIIRRKLVNLVRT